MTEIKKPQPNPNDTQVKAVDKLIELYRNTKQPILKDEVFTLYESILNEKQELDIKVHNKHHMITRQ